MGRAASMVSLAALLTFGCGGGGGQTPSPATPTPTLATSPKGVAAVDEDDFLVDPDRDEYRAQAREAAAEFARAHLSKWEIKGIKSELSISSYRVTLDLQRGARRETLDLLVEYFFPEDGGEPYWKARLLAPSLRDAMRQARDAELLKRLNESKAKVEELEEENANLLEADDGGDQGEDNDPRR